MFLLYNVAYSQFKVWIINKFKKSIILHCEYIFDILCCPFVNLNVHHVIDHVSYFMSNIAVWVYYKYLIIHV